jgi:GxxExxY protein
MQFNEITGAIIETAIEIHRRLGPGLLETVYRKILA